MRKLVKIACGLLVWVGTAAVAEAEVSCSNLPIPSICGFDSPNDFSSPGVSYGFYWTDTTSIVTVEQPEGWGCPQHTCNQFSARISNRVSGFNAQNDAWDGEPCSPGPVVLFLPGAAMNNYWSEMELDYDDAPGEGENDPPRGLRLLMKNLYLEGARILEIRYRCQMLNMDIPFYAETGACQHTLLTAVLQNLNQRPIVEHPPGQSPQQTNEPWWPNDADCRFAMGASEGAAQLQFAIEVMDNTDDDGIGVMNRVVYGGGGIFYDMRGTIDCGDTGDDLLAAPSHCALAANSSCKNLEQVDFFFSHVDDDIVDSCGGCWNNCPSDPDPRPDNCNDQTTPPTPENSCSGNHDLEDPLDAASVATYIGSTSNPADDHSRILGGVIVNTGFDHGVNEQANSVYLTRRDSVLNGEDTNEATWQVTHCLCGCPFWGHGTINRTYEMFKDSDLSGRTPIDDWVEFFVDQDVDFDLYSPLSDDFPIVCPPNPQNYCEIVAPPDGIVNPPSCGS